MTMKVWQVWDMFDANMELLHHPDVVLLVDHTRNDIHDGNKERIVGQAAFLCRDETVAKSLCEALPSSRLNKHGEKDYLIETFRTATEVIAALCLSGIVTEFADRRSYAAP